MARLQHVYFPCDAFKGNACSHNKTLYYTDAPNTTTDYVGIPFSHTYYNVNMTSVSTGDIDGYKNTYSETEINYETVGTKIGEWYVPSIFELGCAFENQGEIATTVNKLNKIFDIGAEEFAPKRYGCSTYIPSMVDLSYPSIDFKDGRYERKNNGGTGIVRYFISIT